MTVLILAPELDITADRVVGLLRQRGLPVVRFDTAWFPQRASLDAECHLGRWAGRLTVGEWRVELEELRSVWYRNPNTFQLPAELSATERHWAMAEAKLGLGGVLTALPGVLWVNHPARNADASYKPVQLATAARCGLTTPDTLVTNEPEAVRRFATGRDTITKALGAPSIVEEGTRKTAFTHRLGAAKLADLRGVEITAHQFQQWVPKAHEARVIVVGDRVFAAGIHASSDAAYVDWRNDYPALRYEQLDPPGVVVDGVLDYCTMLDLRYGAFDFVIGPDGRWVFLECNPGGQYGWIEDATGLPISETLADLLAKGSPT